MTTHDLIEAAPINAAYGELERIIDAAHTSRNQPLASVLEEFRRFFKSAIDDAQNVEFRHDVPDYAKIHGLSESAVYKRIRRGTLHAQKQGARWIILNHR